MNHIAIILIFVAGSVKVNAQQLASEKPVASFYSKTTKQNLDTKAKASQPAATRSRQGLASAKALPQPSVPGYKPATVQRTATKTARKPASEQKIDMDKINRQRRLNRD
jgi:hypothetical protein